MTKDEALKLALEALELEDMACRYEKDLTPEHIAKAIAALNQAIAEAEQQEPVAWADMDVRGEDKGLSWTPGHFHKTPLYSDKREWQGLTDEDKAELDEKYGDDTLAHFDAIEAKLKEKNT